MDVKPINEVFEALSCFSSLFYFLNLHMRFFVRGSRIVGRIQKGLV